MQTGNNFISAAFDKSLRLRLRWDISKLKSRGRRGSFESFKDAVEKRRNCVTIAQFQTENFGMLDDI